MKKLLVLVVALICLASVKVSAQQEMHEFAPIVERKFEYKNWSLKSISDDKNVDLRDFAKDRKLVLVVYFAPWCGNWSFQKPFVERLYKKYKANGFDVIAVSEYGAISDSKKLLDNKEASYQIVSESTTYNDRTTTEHFKYRQLTEDKRRWGSPWNLFFEPSAMRKKGDVLLEKAYVVNGELVEAEVEKFVREKLGLPAEEAKKETASKAKIEACAPDEKKIDLAKKP